jgi:hypothetical protein
MGDQSHFHPPEADHSCDYPGFSSSRLMMFFDSHQWLAFPEVRIPRYQREASV